MDPTVLALVALVFGLLIGLVAGWFFGSLPAAQARAALAVREGEAKELDGRFRQAITELAVTSERARQAEKLESELRSSRQDREALYAEISSLKTSAQEREKAMEERYSEREVQFTRELKRLEDAEEKLQSKFNEVGEKMLSSAQTKFLESAEANLAALNKQSLDALEKKVGPVGESLERYRKRIEEIEKNNSAGFNQLHGVISEVRAGQERVVEGANRITTTLRGATKARGDWGELQLENLLESCGLYEKADFEFQTSVMGEDGILRPDAVINVPGGRKIIVDVKNVFNTYAQANEAESEEERQELLRAHARELRKHIDDLSAKRYQDYVEGSADFVVMFIPGEHVLYAALTQDSSLLNYALKKQIVLSSPLNFMSIALTISTIWRQASFQADAAEIARLGKELYDRLGVVAGHLGALRKSLSSTNQHFDRLVGSFDTNLRRTGERFEQLSVDTSAQELTEALSLNTQPRKLVNFVSEEEGAASNVDDEGGGGV